MKVLFLSALLFCGIAPAQSISSGTVTGVVTDPSGAAIAGAAAVLHNAVSNYSRTASTDAAGGFRFSNVPLNGYQLEVTAPGFSRYKDHVALASTVPVKLEVRMTLAGALTTVQVEATADLVENVPMAHDDVDQTLLASLPTGSPGAGLSAAITLSSPGVVADSNGFFHPLGDHAQTSFVIDGQPISDQQSKEFSTQIPVNAIESMQLSTGMPAAQYGDKTSLVVDAVTRSGLGKKLFGDLETYYGSFGTVGENASVGGGTDHFGEFLVANVARSGRFLDSPEFNPMHDIGNNSTFFDRLDFQPNTTDAFHLDLFAARNWFQIPDTYDQVGQDQRQRVVSFNVAPGYQHTFNPSTLLTVNPWARRDSVDYYPSGDPFQDLPATLAQHRTLFNYGVRADLALVRGRHNLKVGTELKQTRLLEDFSLGITDPSFNPVCLDASGAAAGLPTVTDPAACGALGLTANPNLMPGLVPYDLTRGGQAFLFHATGNVKGYAGYIQDTITRGRWTWNLGLRADRYDGPSRATSLEPRVGASYQVKATGTVLRVAWSRKSRCSRPWA